MRKVIVESPYAGGEWPNQAVTEIEYSQGRCYVALPGGHTSVGESLRDAVQKAVVLRNASYTRECLLDCLKRGESPLASHLLYTQVLDDTNEAERVMGIMAGLEWQSAADAIVVYNDHGISSGMRLAIERACEAGRTVEYRRLYEGC